MKKNKEASTHKLIITTCNRAAIKTRQINSVGRVKYEDCSGRFSMTSDDVEIAQSLLYEVRNHK